MDKIEAFKIGVMQGDFPRYLFKYQGLGTFRDHTLSELTLRFTRPSRFNDPFEFRYWYDDKSESDDWNQFLSNQKLSPSEKKELHQKIMSIPAEDRAKFVDERIKEVFERCGLLCLTKKNDNLLMWAHYADEHRGVCIEFDMMGDPELFGDFGKVEYDNNFPEIDYIKEQSSGDNTSKSNTILKITKHKSPDWSYEQEYRVLKLNLQKDEDHDAVLHYKPGALRAIYFGSRVSAQDIADIKRILQSKGMTHVKTYQSVLSNRSYSMTFKAV